MKYSLRIAFVTFLMVAFLPPVELADASQKNIDKDYNNTTMKVETKPMHDPLRSWVDRLAMAESGGNANVSIVDTNNKNSTGCLQFQDATWIWQGDKHGVDTSMENIKDCSMQKDLAYKMIKADYNNWKHWRCSVAGCSPEQIGTNYSIPAKVGLPPRS